MSQGPSKVGQTRRAPHPVARRQGLAGDGKKTARVTGAHVEVLGFPAATSEVFDHDLVLDVLICPVLGAASGVFCRRGCRPGCACRGKAVCERPGGTGLGRPVVAAFFREGVWAFFQEGVWKRVGGEGLGVWYQPESFLGAVMQGSWWEVGASRQVSAPSPRTLPGGNGTPTARV